MINCIQNKSSCLLFNIYILFLNIFIYVHVFTNKYKNNMHNKMYH